MEIGPAPTIAVGTVLGVVASVHVGAPRKLERGVRSYWSAIEKARASGPVAVDVHGLAGDRQADRKNHGGADKAVHAHFLSSLAELARLAGLAGLDPGTIGVNVAIAGEPGRVFDERAAAIGDRYRIGDMLVEVTQPRIPCSKQADQLGGGPGLVDAILHSGRTGLYLRVLEGGHIRAGDRVVLAARPHPTWPVARVTALVARGGPPEDWTDLLHLPALGAGLRKTAVARLGRIQDAGASRVGRTRP